MRLVNSVCMCVCVCITCYYFVINHVQNERKTAMEAPRKKRHGKITGMRSSSHVWTVNVKREILAP